MHKLIQYGCLLALTAAVWLLVSCWFDTDDDPPAGEPPLKEIEGLPDSVRRVSLDSAGNGSVTLTDLSNANVFLVKVNIFPYTKNASIGPATPATGEDNDRVPAGYITIDGETIVRYERQQQVMIPLENTLGVSRSASPSFSYASATVGTTKEFYLDAKATKKSATLKKIGTHCKIWVVDANFNNGSPNNNDNQITQTQINALADKFDLIYPLETYLLGYEYGAGGNGGMDRDPQIQILVYDLDEDFGKHGNSMTLGYFYAGDEYKNGTFTLSGTIYSNESEIFYLDAESLDYSPDTIYSTLIHEFNHMINYNLKVLQTGRSSNWESWYTEMLSMLAEDVIGPLVGIPYNPSSANGHVINERIPTWLFSYAGYGVMQWNNYDSLPYYASNYAFGAYLVRNFGGPQLLSDIAKSASSGRTSLNQSLKKLNGQRVDTDYALARFGEALVYSTSTGIPSRAYSFDKTVSWTVGSTEYSFNGFDIRGMAYTVHTVQGLAGLFQGPVIYQYQKGASYNVPPYGVQVFFLNDLSDNTLIPKTGSLTVEVEVDVQAESNGVYYFVMVD
jgi:hypothetical protein